MKNKINSRVNRFLDIPTEIYSEESKIIINGFNNAIIENYVGIFEYDETSIKIKTNLGAINITGDKLILKNLDDDDLSINGDINQIEFEKIND